MKIGIMQPYVFPYIGYYQLINSVDKFIIYDDVTYIKQGWINRNNVLVNNKACLFTIPLDKPSSSKLIADTFINRSIYKVWQKKFLKLLEQNYGKAPYFKSVFSLIQQVVNSNEVSITRLAELSITLVIDYLGKEIEYKLSSEAYRNQDLSGQQRVIDICKQEKGNQYINPIGGMKLYDKGIFEREGLELYFIKSNTIEYKQFTTPFVPNLSIIDVLMFNSPQTVNSFLKEYSLV